MLETRRTLVVDLAVSVLIVGCQGHRQPGTTPAATTGSIQYSGGNGADCDHAVVIVGAAHTGEGIDAEDAWIGSRFPAAKKFGQGLQTVKDKAYDIIEFTSADGIDHRVCFDITSFFGKF